MIQRFAEVDLDAVMEIWLSSNLQAHPFIVPSYWAEHLEEVKRLIRRQRFMCMNQMEW